MDKFTFLGYQNLKSEGKDPICFLYFSVPSRDGAGSVPFLCPNKRYSTFCSPERLKQYGFVPGVVYEGFQAHGYIVLESLKPIK